MTHQLKDKFIGAWVAPETKSSLRQLAQLRGVTQSKLLRILIDDAVKRASGSIATEAPQPAKEQA